MQICFVTCRRYQYQTTSIHSLKKKNICIVIYDIKIDIPSLAWIYWMIVEDFEQISFILVATYF